jgi:chemotaxis methyl-accepting protein methylase
MGSPKLASWQLQHIVFPGGVQRRRGAVNVTPAAAAPADPDSALAAVPSPAEIADPFVAWVFDRAGLNAAAYRHQTLRRRLPACLRALRARSPIHARQLLERTPMLVPMAVSALLVGVTAFLRDPDIFALLRGVLPELAAGRPGVHVWSAGCADGAEVYSVALLLEEAGLLSGSYVLGTDCRPDALRRARDGHYDTAAIRQVPPDLLRRYFEFTNGTWLIHPALRRAVRWRSGDVLTTIEPGLWDVILFRNAAMYMRPDALYPLWEKLEQALRPGGLLVLGKAERPAGTQRLTPVGACVYRRTRG